MVKDREAWRAAVHAVHHNTTERWKNDSSQGACEGPLSDGKTTTAVRGLVRDQCHWGFATPVAF